MQQRLLDCGQLFKRIGANSSHCGLKWKDQNQGLGENPFAVDFVHFPDAHCFTS